MSNPYLLLIKSLKQHDSIISRTSSFVWVFRGSILSRMEPSKMVESCIIIVIDSLNYLRLNCEISTPSMIIFPDIASNTLNKVSVMVDLPAPVRPTTPIFSFGYMTNDKSLKAVGKFSRYYTA